MRRTTGLGFAAVLAAGAGAAPAVASPGVEIRHAVARVTVIPEARSDVAVTVARANARLPLKITRFGDQVVIDGGLGWRSPDCHGHFGRPSASVWGIGDIGYDAMPQVVIRTPRDAHVGADGAVFGTINAGQSVDLASGGCGDWSVGDQTGPLRIRLSGSGNVRAGSAASADLHLSGSSDVVMKTARSDLTAQVTGSGDVTADQVIGAFRARVAGSGNVRVRGGAVTDMDVTVSGSGNVHFGGVARSLEARVSGSGDVSAARVTGPVSRQVTGSGDVSIGR
jgi:hypothetical protein